MKIGQMPASNRPATATQTPNKPVKAPTPNKRAPVQSAEDVTQAALQNAQATLNNDAQSDVDYDKVAQMQAALAAGDLTVNPDDLAASMLNFFQK